MNFDSKKDVLFIIFAMLDIFKQVQVKRNDGIVASHNRYKLGQMSICFVGSSFCLMAHGKARIQVFKGNIPD